MDLFEPGCNPETDLVVDCVVISEIYTTGRDRGLHQEPVTLRTLHWLNRPTTSWKESQRIVEGRLFDRVVSHGLTISIHYHLWAR